MALSLLPVVLYRLVPPPATPLMLLRLVEGYGLRRTAVIAPRRPA